MQQRRPELPARVLVLDDEPLILRGWERWRARHGIAIATARSSDQAREVVGREPRFDLVLCDFQLTASGAGVTSEALVHELSAAGQPAVVMTGDPERAARALRGAAPIVNKRSDVATVLAAAWEPLL